MAADNATGHEARMDYDVVPNPIYTFPEIALHYILGGSGHIAGVISPPSKGRGYWTNDKPVKDAEQWLESAESHKGSWWPDWLEWLKSRSGEQVAPPSMGSAAHPPITPAPGSYVLEK